MHAFMESLTIEERKELLDYLHRCRHQCPQEGPSRLLENLSTLLRLLEFGTTRPRKQTR